MELCGPAKRLRVFVGERDKSGHKPLYEALLSMARDSRLAGATVTRGLMSFGATSRIRSARVLDLSADLPVIVEIVDTPNRIESFLPLVKDLVKKAGCGALITAEVLDAWQYAHTGA